MPAFVHYAAPLAGPIDPLPRLEETLATGAAG